MSFQSEPGVIRWRMHFSSTPQKVFEALTTETGRANFWAESAPEFEERITFHILNFEPFSGKVLRKEANRVFEIEYLGTNVRFDFIDDGHGGTDLSMLSTAVLEIYKMEMVSGWVSVLMAMKAAVDFGVDLRNHDPQRSWQQGFADN